MFSPPDKSYCYMFPLDYDHTPTMSTNYDTVGVIECPTLSRTLEDGFIEFTATFQATGMSNKVHFTHSVNASDLMGFHSWFGSGKQDKLNAFNQVLKDVKSEYVEVDITDNLEVKLTVKTNKPGLYRFGLHQDSLYLASSVMCFVKVAPAGHQSWNGHPVELFAKGDWIAYNPWEPHKYDVRVLRVNDFLDSDKIYCTAVGFPTPEIELFHDGTLVSHSHPRLTTVSYEPDVTRLVYYVDLNQLPGELGTYTCQAKSGSVIVEENVQAIIELNTTVVVQEHTCDQISAECHISGNPLPDDANFNVFCKDMDVPVAAKKETLVEDRAMVVKLQTTGAIAGTVCLVSCKPDNPYDGGYDGEVVKLDCD